MRNARLVRWAAKNEITRGIVKVLMSKNELLQNNAVEKEAKKLWPYMEDAKVSQYTVSFWFNALEDIPRFIFVVLRIVVYIFLLKQVIESNASMSDIGVFILVMAFMEKSTDNILQVSREILKDSFQMTKLWDTFDQLPKIK